jgi:dipeptidyl-peptidase-4
MLDTRASSLLTLILAGGIGLSFVSSAAAQRVYTAHDYQQAERWMSYNVHGLVHHDIRDVTYLPDGRVFYGDPGLAETVYMLAGPAAGGTTWSIAPAFDNAKLAAALSAASKRNVQPAHLYLSGYMPEPGGFAVTTTFGDFHCNASATNCTEQALPTPHPVTSAAKADASGRRNRAFPPFNLSPDKQLAAFVRNNNLWVRVQATGEERQLTFDGVQDFGYATDDAGWQHTDAAILTWSPDSKKIATFQQDQRKTGMMYLVPVTNRHPELEAWRYPLLGDKDVTMIEPVVIDVASAKVVRLKLPPQEHRSMECDDVSCNGDSHWTDVEFSPDGAHLALVTTSRDHKDEWVRVASTASGDVREVYHEHVPTYYGWQSKTNFKYLPGSNEFLWVSERSNWAQIYLYDMTTGELKNQVTHGDGPVTDLLRVDEKNRVLYFTADGKERGEDPYFTNYYRVDFDGRHQQLLTPEVANHDITASPDGGTFADIYSTAETPSTAVIRDDRGKVLLTLAHEDISALLSAGWKPPTPITVKARDGKTPLYGFLWKPTTFNAAKRYPIIDYVYPGPFTGSCTTRSFAAAERDNQSLADLGFIVVCIDGMGTPNRTKSFHDAHASSPAEMGDDTIPDQVAGIKDLAARFAWIASDHVGIWGHSGGGNATASAMFHFPEFFNVGWAESGNHDQRDYEDDWDERWAGLEVIGPNGEDNYAAQANQNYAKNLKGRLMLTYGTMDDNVPPNNTLLVVDALIKANKNFDMLLIPNAHHPYGNATPYVTRRRWDYFVRYLAGGVPPNDYQMTSEDEILRKLYGPAAENGAQ